MNIHGPKTQISEIPEANDRIIAEVARLTKTSTAEVEDVIGFVGRFTADIIEQGDMEGVMIPYFGKFRPKIKHLRLIKKIEQGKENGMLPIYRALKAVKDNPARRGYIDLSPQQQKRIDKNHQNRVEKGRSTEPKPKRK